MKEYLSIIISLLALIISAITFWLTRFRKGILKMTRPSIIFFGPDGGESKEKKIFIRTLLYSTSEKGHYVQNMFIKLYRGESVQNFNIWVYDNNGLVRGSGLFVNKSGIVCNHHFLMPKDGTIYNFLEGDYMLQVFVETVNKKPEMIFQQTLFLTREQANEMKDKQSGTYFDWAPNSQNYHSHVDTAPKKNKEMNDFFEKMLDLKENK